MPIILLPARYKACKEGTEEVSDKIDWTKAWNRKYPILDRFLVLKDILAEVWKVRKQSGRTIQ